MSHLLSRRAIIADAYVAAGGPSYLASDDFNRADGAIGTSSSGHVWTVGGGTWSIVSNRLLPPNTGGYPQVNIDVAVADVVIEVTVHPTSGTDIGLAGRVTDDSAYVLFNVSRVGDHYVCRIFERIGGGFNPRSALVDPVPGIVNVLDPMLLRLELSGTGGEGFVNGLSVGTITTPLTTQTTQTRHGIAVGSGSSHTYDDWSVT